MQAQAGEIACKINQVMANNSMKQKDDKHRHRQCLDEVQTQNNGELAY